MLDFIGQEIHEGDTVVYARQVHYTIEMKDARVVKISDPTITLEIENLDFFSREKKLIKVTLHSSQKLVVLTPEQIVLLRNK